MSVCPDRLGHPSSANVGSVVGGIPASMTTFAVKPPGEIMTEEQRRLQLMERLHDHIRPEGRQFTRLSELVGEFVDDQDGSRWMGTVHGLAGDGLITFHNVLVPSDWMLEITAQGRAWVEALRAERANPVARRRAAASGVLTILSESDPDGTSWTPANNIVERGVSLSGERLPDEVIRRTIAFLLKAGLVGGAGDSLEHTGPSNVRLTEPGQECVESGLGVDEFLERGRKQEPTVQNVFSGQFTESNIAAGSSNFTQTLSASGLVADELASLLQAIMQALPALNLSSDQEAVIARNVDAVRGELREAKPDEGVVKTMMRRTADGLGTAAAAALGVGLNLLVKYEMARMGIPIE